MPNTYSQIYIQLVFATKGRDNKIINSARDEIEKYICGIFNNKGQKVLAIYANPDHVHIFFSYKNLQITISDLVKTVKTESTNFINGKKAMSKSLWVATRLWCIFLRKKSERASCKLYFKPRITS